MNEKNSGLLEPQYQKAPKEEAQEAKTSQIEAFEIEDTSSQTEEEEQEPEKPATCKETLTRLAQIFKAPCILWTVLFSKFLESFAYFIVSFILTTYLSDHFGCSDVQAGNIYGLLGFASSVYAVLLGQIVDFFGVRCGLILGSLLVLLGRFSLTFTDNLIVFSVFLFTLVSIGTALIIPILQIAIKRVVKAELRSAAFAGFYMAMNIGALLSGIVIDGLRLALPPGKDKAPNAFVTWSLPGDYQFQIDYERCIFIVAVGASFLSFLICLLCIRRVQNQQEIRSRNRNVFSQCREVLCERRFWKFSIFISLLCFVKMIFRHLDATFPKYAVRVLGQHSPWGTIVSINPLLILFLVPLATPLSFHMNAYTQILIGALISGLSPFALAISSSIPAAVIFVILLSVGQALWSPRLYDYTVSIVDKGKEGVYLGLSHVPLFAAALLSGMVSGYLLEYFCPEQGEKKPRMLWSIIGVISMISFIGLLMFRSCLELKPSKESIQQRSLR